MCAFSASDGTRAKIGPAAPAVCLLVYTAAFSHFSVVAETRVHTVTAARSVLFVATFFALRPVAPLRKYAQFF